MSALSFVSCFLLLAVANGSLIFSSSVEDPEERFAIVRKDMPHHIAESVTRSKYIVYVLQRSSRSHAKPFFAVAEVLMKRGHRIGFASLLDAAFEWAKDMNFTRHIPLKSNLEYENPGNTTLRHIMNDVGLFMNLSDINIGGGRIKAYKRAAIRLRTVVDKFYEGVYMSLIEEFQQRPPDLLVCDWNAVSCIDYAKATKTPHVIIVTVPLQHYFQNGDVPIFLPQALYGETPFSRSYLDRVIDTFITPFIDQYYFRSVAVDLAKVREKVGAIFPSEKRRQHLFMFNYFGMDIPRYTSPFFHMLGPVFEEDKQVMDDHLKAWLDGIALEGHSVVYMAFGGITVVPPNILKIMICGILFESGCETDLNLPSKDRLAKKVHLLWASRKADVSYVLGSEINREHSSYNLQYLKWAPQRKILSHPAVKLFVSHGGIESIFESNLAAKPMLFLPGFVDQPYNARRAYELGFGEYLDYATVTAEEVRTKRRHLLNQYEANSTFREHLDKIAKIVYYSSQRYESAASIMEMEAEVGSEHLETPEDSWPFYRLHNFDVYALPFVLVILLFVVIKIRRYQMSIQLDIKLKKH